MHQQCLLGVGYAGQVADRWRPGVQHPQGGDLPVGQCLRQPVGIDEVLGTPPGFGAGPSGEVVGRVGLKDVQV